MSTSSTLKMFIVRLDNPYESSVYFKLPIHSKFVILTSLFMALRVDTYSFLETEDIADT